MSRPILVLRPQPGAEETARRARDIGLDPIVAPLFTIAAREWRAPDPQRFDAVMLTSANAPLLAGPALAPFTRLPAFAVGEATAKAACGAGFADVRTGPSDAAALAELMAADGVRTAFHPCGEDRVALREAGFEIVSVPVYAAEPVAALPAAAAEALDRGAVALLHSPRAAALFATLATGRRSGTRIAAISAAAAEAAGHGWLAVAVAERPRDQALLELAAKLCQNEGA
jgi:uroporphyrinogen-III synthase